jgi:Mo-dependent nitrogenase C-terminus
MIPTNPKSLPNHIMSMRKPNSVIFPTLLFQPVCQWLESLQIKNYQRAHAVCQLIPASCPFERTVRIFGITILQIPPLCKLNPFYEQLMGLRFRALVYLADECGEDITIYC